MNMKPFISELHLRWVMAEFIGTLLLTVTVGIALIGGELYPALYQALFIPFVIGLAVIVLVYLFGPISGAHFNPAVTISLWVVRKIHLEQMVVYVVSQMLGAYAGIRLVKLLLGTLPNFTSSLTTQALLGEFLGAFILVLAVTSVVIRRVPASVGGLVIGLALIMGITISLIPSGGVLNPAIALVLGAVHLAYLVAPIVGGLCGAAVAVVLTEPEAEQIVQP